MDGSHTAQMPLDAEDVIAETIRGYNALRSHGPAVPDGAITNLSALIAGGLAGNGYAILTPRDVAALTRHIGRQPLAGEDDDLALLAAVVDDGNGS